MDGPPPPEEDFSSLSISERLSHKNWKARVNAYEALTSAFQTSTSDEDPVFKPYTSNPDLLKKIVTDSNAVAQERGVECIIALVKFAGENAAKTHEAVVPALVEKCLGSTRAATKTQAVELILQYVEVSNGAATIIDELLPGLSAKQPKAVSGCILALKEITRFRHSGGIPTPLLKTLPKIFSHTDKTVRSEGTQLTYILYQGIGQGIEPWLADLKPVQVKELKEAFDTMDKEGKGKGTLKPERLTRAQARTAEEVDETGAEEQTEPQDDAPPDPRTFAEAVNIAPKLSASLYTDLKSSKWKERKEALDDLSTLLSSSPRIQDSPELAELAKTLATRVATDANINCVIVAASCLEELAKGMMASFSKYHEAVVPPLLERLKERKANVTDSIGAALDAVFLTTDLPDIIADLDNALKSKNPQVKEGTLKFLGRCLATATTPIQTPQIKVMADQLAVLLEDGFEGARNEAAICFGTLMKMVGERPLNAVMENLADVRKAKVKEAYEKAVVKCKSGGNVSRQPAPSVPKAAPVAKSNAAKKPPTSKPTAAVDEQVSSAAKPAPKPPVKKPSTASSSSAPAVKKPPPSSSAPPKSTKSSGTPLGTLDNFKLKHTPEDAEVLISDLIPASIITGFADANWKTRLSALEEMSGWIDTQIESVDAELIVRALAKKGWSEKNFQVSSKLYGIFSTLSQQCPSFGRSCVALSAPHLTEKLGDLKLKKPAGDALLSFSEKTSLQFVLNQAYEPLSKQKAPKVLSDALTWINTALIEFGVAGISLRALIDFLKAALQNSNASVRTSATKTLVTVKLFSGSGVKDLLEDLNPQLLNTISSEFEKVEGTPAPEPSRTSLDVVNMTTSSGTGKTTSAIADPVDDLFPRVEIDGLLKGTTILSDSKNDAWKVKKEALESLQAILDQGSNKRLKSSMGEIGQILKARVVDTNKAVQTLALDIVARIAEGMGRPFEKHARLFVLPVSTVLSDQKAPIRNAALQTLTAIASACDIEPMVTGVSSALETSNPMQKGTLLHWLAGWFKEHEPSQAIDLKAWVSPVLLSLDDRNSDVRKGAQAVLPILVRCIGFDHVMQQTSSLKPASRSSALPLIQAARATSIPETTAITPRVAPKSTTPVPTAEEPNGNTQPSKPSGAKISGVRRKLPLGPSQSESRPVGELSNKHGNVVPPKRMGVPSAVSEPSGNTPPSAPFFGVSLDAKRNRLGKDISRWVNEGGPTRKDLAELLQVQMEPHASKDLVGQLFSHDHNAINDHISGLTSMSEFYANAVAGDETTEMICTANLDLALKYISIKIHEPQPNLISKCLEVVEAVISFLRHVNYQISDAEATCFIPTIIFKLGDAREPVRVRVQNIIRTLPTVYPYSRVFHLLLEYGIKAKVAKTRQGSLDEMSAIIKKSGMGACEPSKAFPVIASLISDKDPAVRKSALGTISEAYCLVGEKVWTYVGSLSSKDKTQLEERLRRTPGPSSHERKDSTVSITAPTISRIAAGIPRPASPSVSAVPRLPRPASPVRSVRSASPALSNMSRPESPARASRLPTNSSQNILSSPTNKSKTKTMLPSRLGRPRAHAGLNSILQSSATNDQPLTSISTLHGENTQTTYDEPTVRSEVPDDITLTISSILSNDPSRSVDALKKIQRILALGPEVGPSSPQYRELADHTEGLIETITLQMAHVFERPDELVSEDNFRLAKHLIQTLNNFCDHPVLAESLTVDIITSLLEELTLRLLETDDSPVKKVKDLSRFINMIILRLFATGRRMSIFRALFALLLQIVKPFPSNGTLPDSKESKVAELVLKCVWKLARNIPQDLSDSHLDPVELFPAIEHFLQSVPPNEWRARATNKVPCGDMPLRTIKVIIQHVVAHYGDEVYELLSASFDDPSATIVYPYVYRILNSGNRAQVEGGRRGVSSEHPTRPVSPVSSRPLSPQETVSSVQSGRNTQGHMRSPSSSSIGGNGTYSPNAEEPDPDAQLLTIIGHISSETTGAMHKEGITELHHFLKAYPQKRPRVEKLLESTGPAFRKYINRALATRAAEDQEREVAVTNTLSKLEHPEQGSGIIQTHESSPRSPVRASYASDNSSAQERLSRLHDIFQYRASTVSTTSSQSHAGSS
ncbi:microtubule associated protein [Cyathus striatus]|nr:microtubule associated protein [Cyathus striatus]